jgi:putative transposase
MFDFYTIKSYAVNMRTGFRCRAHPDEEQRAMLNRTFGCVRLVWNRTLAARRARAKARVKVARAHAKIADARRDFLHKTSTGLIGRFDVIALEDLPYLPHPA